MECVVLRRMNRFVVKVLLNGKRQDAYVNNTGRLVEYLVRGRRGFCIRTKKTGKIDYCLFALGEDDVAVVIDTQLQMKAFEKALEMGLVPWANPCRILKRNAQLGRCLIDYLMECSRERVYLEVKSAVQKRGRICFLSRLPIYQRKKACKGAYRACK